MYTMWTDYRQQKLDKALAAVLNRCWPALATLAQHLPGTGSVSACTLWTHCHQQKTLPRVELMLARAGDGGPALSQHQVSAVLT